MNTTTVHHFESSEIANLNCRFRCSRSRPLPKRGQIKSKIVANVCHSIVSVIYRASSLGLHSSTKN
ncbi:hypothetical protein MtrunA17_Chr8g0387381 [Medicago truncatula]|uniref:Uncharacterized protein n=1 Tax=Medicago truncatula TaxID=3880 RepID=A0A396GXN3_MEDTR|nr:hypothetical protein MtrunA17_Chr8g0387381 [Medicago truncatula]